MKIAESTVGLVRAPLKVSWADQTHQANAIDLVIVRLRSNDGLEGVGYSWSLGVGSSAVAAMLEREVLPLLGNSEVSPRRTWPWLWARLHDAGGGGVVSFALAAVDIALWDLAGKEQGRSLVELLGIQRDEIKAYGSGIDLHFTADELVREVSGWMEAGYRGVKIKVGHQADGEDERRVEAVKQLAGSLPVMVDANQGWNLASARRECARLSTLGVLWVEEPLLADDVEGHARLRSGAGTAIAAGENLYTKFQFRDYLVRDALDYCQPDVVRVGGITPFLPIAELAAAWDVPLAPHYNVELTGQLLCCLEGAEWVEDVQGGSLWELGILAEKVGVENGLFRPPGAPGHGLMFDWGAVERRTVGRTDSVNT